MTPLIGIGTGFTGLPVSVPQKTRGNTTRARVFLQNRMKNLAIAVQVSIDTAVRHCEVKFSGRELGYRRRRSRSCSGFVLVTGGWGGGRRGRTESLVGWRPYAFIIPLLCALHHASAVSVGFMVVAALTNQLYQQEVMSK